MQVRSAWHPADAISARRRPKTALTRNARHQTDDGRAGRHHVRWYQVRRPARPRPTRPTPCASDALAITTDVGVSYIMVARCAAAVLLMRGRWLALGIAGLVFDVVGPILHVRRPARPPSRLPSGCPARAWPRLRRPARSTRPVVASDAVVALAWCRAVGGRAARRWRGREAGWWAGGSVRLCLGARSGGTPPGRG
ncbi:hypothetical protein EBO15_04770 [Actinomadura harenae]|uniref:Uncharacterized protein n=1 Tax=Actinomadura harenae TaxID=2483351 RepID=A0A3M2MBQ7_9ACTN|nr:hypothetical protein EBO15_04770 [Actinomadura harenae]